MRRERTRLSSNSGHFAAICRDRRTMRAWSGTYQAPAWRATPFLARKACSSAHLENCNTHARGAPGPETKIFKEQ